MSTVLPPLAPTNRRDLSALVTKQRTDKEREREKSSSATTTAITSDNKRMWCYKDPQGDVQGELEFVLTIQGSRGLRGGEGVCGKSGCRRWRPKRRRGPAPRNLRIERIFLNNDCPGKRNLCTGPFAAAQLMEWLKAGFYSEDLPVRRTDEKTFRPLTVAFKLRGEEMVPPGFARSEKSITSPDSSVSHL